jgi:hypothetical protein
MYLRASAFDAAAGFKFDVDKPLCLHISYSKFEGGSCLLVGFMCLDGDCYPTWVCAQVSLFFSVPWLLIYARYVVRAILAFFPLSLFLHYPSFVCSQEALTACFRSDGFVFVPIVVDLSDGLLFRLIEFIYLSLFPSSVFSSKPFFCCLFVYFACSPLCWPVCPFCRPFLRFVLPSSLSIVFAFVVTFVCTSVFVFVFVLRCRCSVLAFVVVLIRRRCRLRRITMNFLRQLRGNLSWWAVVVTVWW